MHINKLFSLNGKVAVVIGGAGKIGLPISEALAESGATVYIASRSPESYKDAVKNFQKRNLDVHGIQLDFTNEKSVEDAIKYIDFNSKIPDILVNSACGRPMKRFMDDTIENWDLSMEINARGMFIVNRAFARVMAKQKKGSIINISSIYGVVAPDMSIYKGSDFETEPDYPFLKGGAIMLSKYFASYYAEKNVRFNVISPGGFYNNQPEPFFSKYIQKVPMKRMAYHDDMKGAVVFLASNASSYITGCNIPVDGGWTIV